MNILILAGSPRKGGNTELLAEAFAKGAVEHHRAWLCTCQQVRPPYEFYLREGFKPYKSEEVGPGLTWAYLEK